MDYSILEVSGKQYKVLPKKPFLVDLQEGETISAKVLATSEKGQLKIGTPYLEKDIKLKVLGQIAGEKIRVAKFHAKANYRRVTGSRKKFINVVWES